MGEEKETVRRSRECPHLPGTQKQSSAPGVEVRPSSPDRAVERKARTPGGHEDPLGSTGQHPLGWGAGLAQHGLCAKCVPRLRKVLFELV